MLSVCPDLNPASKALYLDSLLDTGNFNGSDYSITNPMGILKPEVFPLLSHWMPHLHRVSKWNLVLISESELLDWFPQLLKCSVLFWKWIILQNSNELGHWLLFWANTVCLILLVMSHILLSIQRNLTQSIVFRADIWWQQWWYRLGNTGTMF